MSSGFGDIGSSIDLFQILKETLTCSINLFFIHTKTLTCSGETPTISKTFSCTSRLYILKLPPPIWKGNFLLSLVKMLESIQIIKIGSVPLLHCKPYHMPKLEQRINPLCLQGLEQ